MILAIEYLNDDDEIVVDHLNPDGTTQRFTSLYTNSEHLQAIDIYTAQISVYLGPNEAGIATYRRICEIRNELEEPVIDLIDEMLENPIETYSNILRIYVEAHQAHDNDDED